MKPVESLLGGGLALAGLFLYLAGMVFRTLSLPLSGAWIEEVSVYLVVWGLLLSAAGCVATSEHVRADFLLRVLGPRWRQRADVLADAAGLAFCASLAGFGWQVVDFALLLDERGPSYLQIPTAWYYAALPTSMAFCALRYAGRLLAHVRAGRLVARGPEP